MGWTEAEELVIVLETGVVHWYSILGASFVSASPFLVDSLIG
jgi:hypothetical protein